MSIPQTDHDLIIIGAGPAGLALARALSGHGLRIAVVERQTRAVLADPAPDGREIALTHRSVAMLRELDAWDRIPPAEISPLASAEVRNAGSSHRIRFEPRHPESERLGQFVPNDVIRRALFASVAAASDVTLIDDVAASGIATGAELARVTLPTGVTLSARLVVAADTRFSEMRRRMGIGARMLDFGKTMMVARMAHEVAHHAVTTEWFGIGQTIATLPLNGTAEAPNLTSMVVTLPAREIERLMALDAEAFGREITRRYDNRLGAMRLVGPRHAYPLMAVYASRFVAQRFALVGDAAVGMHPVTAHGFNFGLIGQQILADQVLRAAGSGGDIADPGRLRRFEARLRRETLPLYLATNATARLYTDDRLPARVLRDAVIRAGERLAPVRRVVSGHLMSDPGQRRPSLLRELARA